MQRIVTQVIMFGVNIVTKSFMQAYQQAKAGAYGAAAQYCCTGFTPPSRQAEAPHRRWPTEPQLLDGCPWIRHDKSSASRTQQKLGR